MVKYLPEEVMVTFSEIPDEITLCISLTKCPCHCKGCHSPHLWQDIGEELTPEVFQKLIDDNPGCSCVCLFGGDNDPETVIHLLLGYISCTAYYTPDVKPLKTAWYSGRNVIPKHWQWLNYLKLGPYDETKGPLNKPTTNQVLFKVSEVEGHKCLIDITEKMFDRTKYPSNLPF